MGYVCYFCRSLVYFGQLKYFRSNHEITLKCPHCDFEYVTINDVYIPAGGLTEEELNSSEKTLIQERFWQFARDFRLEIEHDENTVWRFKHIDDRLNPTQQLMSALSNANSIVHFITYGLSKEIVGAMKVAATKAIVVGIVSNVSFALDRELKQCMKEIPNLHFVTYRAGHVAAPHTKLVIVDDLIAFDGSTNLTTHGLRQAELKLDRFRLIKDWKEVIKLNNDYFSPVWRRTCASIKRVYLLPDGSKFYLSMIYRFE